MMKTYQNALEIEHEGKRIPYGQAVRDDGNVNHGFMYLKGNPALLETVPELLDDRYLKNLVEAINALETGLFSIGCVSAPVQDARGFRRTGYVEFVIDSVVGCADVRNYFPIFYNFDRSLINQRFSGAFSFCWELQPCIFPKPQAQGFTCSVYLNTQYCATSDAAWGDWQNALAALANFLRTVPRLPGVPINPV